MSLAYAQTMVRRPTILDDNGYAIEESAREVLVTMYWQEYFAHPMKQAPHLTESPLFRITVRQRQIIHLIAQGASYQDVADTLGLARNTITVHLNRLYRRLGVRSKTEAMHTLGLVTLDSKPATDAPCPGGEPAAVLEILLDAVEALESDSLTLQQISRALKARAKVFDARTRNDGSPALLGDV